MVIVAVCISSVPNNSLFTIVALIWVVPFFTAVTSPVESMVATDVSVEVQLIPVAYSGITFAES